MTNERKVRLLSILKELVDGNRILLHECYNEEEKQFILYENNRLIAELEYSINYYEEHKDDTK